MKLNNFSKLVVSIVLSEAAGVIGSLFTAPAIPTWYANLAKPAINPPAWIFGPVWTALFMLMGVSLFLVWNKHSDIRENARMSRAWNLAVGLFILQLILNTLWSVIFFGMRSPGVAFLELTVLWLSILATIMAFSKISKTAAWLLLPYILWVGFAGYLNYSIWHLSVIPSVDIKNTTYEIDGQHITLKDGRAEYIISDDGAAKGVVSYFGNNVRADFDGDSQTDEAFLLTQDNGGSGTFFYLAVAQGNSNGGYTGLNAIFLGDRIAPQTTEFRESQIIVNYADRKPGEPMTVRPSYGVSRYFKVSNGRLTENTR